MGITDREIYQGFTKTEKLLAIEDAQTVSQLDEMWEAWEERGQSPRGIMRAQVLQRKKELGAELSEEEERQIQTTMARAQKGAELPPIKGRLKLF